VVAFVRGLPKDQKHTLSVEWYLGNVKLDLPGTAQTSVVVDGSKNADLNVGCTDPINSPNDVRGSRNAPRPPGDNTDPALQGGAAYTGQSSTADAAAYDPSTGLITGPDGEQMLLGTTGGEQKVLGNDSWKYLLLGPLGS